MLEALQLFLQNLLGGNHQEAIVFILSMTPLVELRGGIIAGYLYDFSLLKTLLISISANLIPVPFILLFIKHIFKFMIKHNLFSNLVEKLQKRAMSKSHKIESLEFWGLLIFVGIPLPGTGAWTGALIASLLNLDFKRAIFAIFCGILLGALIMSLGVYGIISNVF